MFDKFLNKKLNNMQASDRSVSLSNTSGWWDNCGVGPVVE